MAARQPWRLLRKVWKPPVRVPSVIGYMQGATGRIEKRALISYVAWPFHADPDSPHFANHSNGAQSIEIARAFNRLGYVVDVVDWLDDAFVPAVHYDVLFGIHYNFQRLAPRMRAGTAKIYYGTTSYWAFENAADDARAKRLLSERGVRVAVPWRWRENRCVELADAVVAIANEFSLGTYRSHNPCLFRIDNSIIPSRDPELGSKDFDSARRHFLWFGSTKLLRKGLDLALEAFAGLPDLHLWVCGPLESPQEQDLISAYRRELFHTGNIHPVGWVTVGSELFVELARGCAFVVHAPSAEGMPGSVLDCMGQGLVPLVNREAAIDTDGFGVTFEDSSVDTIRRVVRTMAEQPPEVCRRMAVGALEEVKTRYTLERFAENMESILREILGER